MSLSWVCSYSYSCRRLRGCQPCVAAYAGSSKTSSASFLTTIVDMIEASRVWSWSSARRACRHTSTHHVRTSIATCPALHPALGTRICCAHFVVLRPYIGHVSCPMILLYSLNAFLGLAHFQSRRRCSARHISLLLSLTSIRPCSIRLLLAGECESEGHVAQRASSHGMRSLPQTP